jgi:hypothetical protein
VEVVLGELGAAGAAGFAALSLGVDAGAGVEASPLVSVELGGVTDAVELRLSFL